MNASDRPTAAASLAARAGSELSSGAARPRRRGFTLVEALIAVGALGLIAVGISQVFRATGETVRVGRRISNLNAYAAIVERQLREDFAAMTRDGFLLIRNERVWKNGEPGTTLLDARNGIPLVRGHEASRRPRRVDEIVFFATGDFVTARPPASAERVARAPAARIYIGHGLKRKPTNPEYYAPVYLDDDNTTAGLTQQATQTFGYGPDNGPAEPNQYAADWTLLRHVTLLAPPSLGKIDGKALGVSSPSPSFEADPRFRDGPWQIAMQPAARTIFRTLNGDPVTGAGLYNDVLRPAANQVAYQAIANLDNAPHFASGVIDIAATDLSEIRAFIHAAANTVDWQGGPPGVFHAHQRAFAPTAPNETWPTSFPPQTAFNQPLPQNTTVGIMHAWMRDALPAASDAPTYPQAGQREGFGGRIRYEPTPPNPLLIHNDFSTPAFNDPEHEYERADQFMLSAHNFVPGCSEFIVEWSWGDLYPDTHPEPAYRNQIIWHGLPRAVDYNGNGNVDVADGEVVCRPYLDSFTNMEYRQQWVRRNGTLVARPVESLLIHGDPDGNLVGFNNANENVLYSYFGYVNPAYVPADPDLDPPAIPWPWPRLIRITMSLVDPADPTIEQTYQFIFDIPSDPDDPRF